MPSKTPPFRRRAWQRPRRGLMRRRIGHSKTSRVPRRCRRYRSCSVGPRDGVRRLGSGGSLFVGPRREHRDVLDGLATHRRRWHAVRPRTTAQSLPGRRAADPPVVGWGAVRAFTDSQLAELARGLEAIVELRSDRPSPERLSEHSARTARCDESSLATGSCLRAAIGAAAVDDQRKPLRASSNRAVSTDRPGRERRRVRGCAISTYVGTR